MISERWQKAQIEERKLHTMGKDEAIEHYKRAYAHNFKYCEIDPTDLKGKIIYEVGCADVPALMFCKNYSSESLVIEPMPSIILDEICKEHSIRRCKGRLEFCILIGEELWLFNVLQHVEDPEDFIHIAKLWFPTIRYFEPIDTEITDYHLHSFTQSDFERWFGKTNFYNETTIPGFHNGPCCYGIYHA